MIKYNFGEKPTVILYTDNNHHVGTRKQKSKHKITLSGMKLDFSTVYMD